MHRKVRIRPATSDDRALLFIEARAIFGGHPTWRDERTLGVLADDTVFVAEADDGVAGFVALQWEPPVMEIDELMVCSGHEGESVERQLLQFAEGFAISSDATALRAVVEPDNAPAARLYAHAGFTRCGAQRVERRLPTVI